MMMTSARPSATAKSRVQLRRSLRSCGMGTFSLVLVEPGLEMSSISMSRTSPIYTTSLDARQDAQVPWRLVFLQSKLQNRKRCDHGCFGAQNIFAKACFEKTICAARSNFLVRPAAFRTDGQRD